MEKAKEGFKGYNKTNFIKGIPTENIICENVPRTFLERSKPLIPIFFTHNEHKKIDDNKNCFNSVKKRLDPIFNDILNKITINEPFIFECNNRRDHLCLKYIYDFIHLLKETENIFYYKYFNRKKKQPGYLYIYTDKCSPIPIQQLQRGAGRNRKIHITVNYELIRILEKEAEERKIGISRLIGEKLVKQIHHELKNK